MKNYDTTILESLDPSSGIGIKQASVVTGLHLSEVSRLVNTGSIGTITVPGKAKPLVKVGDILEVVRVKNTRANLSKARKARKVKATPKGPKGPQSVVIGIFADCLDRKPDWVEVPEACSTVEDLLTVANSLIKIEKDSTRAIDLQRWITHMEGL